MSRQSELVSQWQERLIAAEQFADGTPRFRWLHAARIRLYRFLLRCYGSGQWRSAVEEGRQTAAVTVSDELGPWQGKPAKTAGKIQAVLKSVHSAQDREPQRGPFLAGGIDGSAYVTVTSSGAKIDARKCKEFLQGHGIEARAIFRGRQRIVEVPYADLQRASVLVDANREQLRPVRRLLTLKTTCAMVRHRGTGPTETQLAVVSILILLPLVAACLLVIGTTLLAGGGDIAGAEKAEPTALAGAFLAASLLTMEIALVWGILAQWRLEWLLAARRRYADIGFACLLTMLLLPAGFALLCDFLATSEGGYSLGPLGRVFAAALFAAGVACYLFRRSGRHREGTNLPAD